MNETIGNYRILEKLGQGGMGTVYKAVDVMLERPVALKVLRSEFAGQADLAERFRTEAVILARLNHPRIATLYGLAREGHHLVMAMEFVEGETLETVLERDGRVQPSVAASWCCQVLDAMAYAHRHDVIHRDIKPANIMVTEEDTIKVMDFGIARVLGSAHQTRYGHVIGTANYMAPEQIRGQEVDGRTDLYALGIVLYQLVTGQLPFRGQDELAIMTAQISRRPDAPTTLAPGLPPWTDAVIMRALEKNPDDRFQNAGEFTRALEAASRLPEEEPTVLGPVSAFATPQVPTPPWSAALPTPGGPQVYPETPGPRMPMPPPPRSGGVRAATPPGPVTTGPVTPPPGFPETPAPVPALVAAAASAPAIGASPAAAGADGPVTAAPQAWPVPSWPPPAPPGSPPASSAETRLVEPLAPDPPARVPRRAEPPPSRAVPVAAPAQALGWQDRVTTTHVVIAGAVALIVLVAAVAWVFSSRPPVAGPDQAASPVSESSVPAESPAASAPSQGPPEQTGPSPVAPAAGAAAGAPFGSPTGPPEVQPGPPRVEPGEPVSAQPVDPASARSPVPVGVPAAVPPGVSPPVTDRRAEEAVSPAPVPSAAPSAAQPKPVTEETKPPAAAGDAADTDSAAGEPEVFEELELISAKEVLEVNLSLYRTRMTLTSTDDDSVVKAVSYASISSASYSENKPSPDTKGGGGVMGKLFGGNKHYVTFHANGETIVMRFGRSYKQIIPAFEKLSRKRVAMPAAPAK